MRRWLETCWDRSTHGFGVSQQWVQTSCWLTPLLTLWSVSEALVWFILPDFILLPLAVLAPGYRIRWVLLTVGGSLVGSFVMLLWVKSSPHTVARVIFNLPFTQPFMMTKVEALAQAYGPWSAMWQPFSAIPVKVWTYEALTALHWNPWTYLLLVSLGRTLRMALIAWLGGWLGRNFSQALRRYWFGWLILYTLLFFTFLANTSSQ